MLVNTMPALKKHSEKDLVDARGLTAALWTVLTSRERLLTWANGFLPKFSCHTLPFTGYAGKVFINEMNWRKGVNFAVLCFLAARKTSYYVR